MERMGKNSINMLKIKGNESIVYFPNTKNHFNVPTASAIDYESGREQYTVISKNKSKKFIKTLEDFEKNYQKDKADDYVQLYSFIKTFFYFFIK